MHFGKVIWKRVEPWQIGTAGLIESFDLRQLNLVILTAAYTDIREWIISHEIMSPSLTAAFLTWQWSQTAFHYSPNKSYSVSGKRGAWKTFRLSLRKSSSLWHIKHFKEKQGTRWYRKEQVHQAVCIQASLVSTPAGAMWEQLYFVSISMWEASVIGKVVSNWGNDKYCNTWSIDIPNESLCACQTFLSSSILFVQKDLEGASSFFTGFVQDGEAFKDVQVEGQAVKMWNKPLGPYSTKESWCILNLLPHQ